MFRSGRVLVSLLAAGLLATAPGLVFAPAAQACAPAMVAPRASGVIDQAGAKIVFIQDGENVTAHVQAQYYGDAKDFSMVMPVQALPMVGVGSNDLFTALRAATKPRFDLSYRTEGKCKERESTGSSAGGASKRAPSAGAAPSAEGAVQVVSRAAVGPYDTTVLKAEDAGSLRKYLDDNGYEIPEQLDASMADYVSQKFYFVALKLQKDRASGDLQPVTLTYKADKLNLPIRLASLSAVPDMDVFVWVLGQSRAVPDNYDHVEINESRIDWFTAGNNYRQVVTEALNEAGGKAWVTDYAGESQAVRLDGGIARRAGLSTEVLLSKTDAADFISYVRSQTFFAEAYSGGQEDKGRLNAFFARYLPKPEQFKDVPDDQFYSQLDAGGPYLDALKELKVDTAKAAAELQETSVKPAAAIVKAFADHPYLTQLYTTMSPEEMVLDPSFVFNTQMEAVSNVHTAEAVTMCSSSYFRENAPVKIKLASGGSFYASEGEEVSVSQTSASPKPETGGPKLPAVQRVMRCGTGAPRPVSDLKSDILATLNRLTNQRIVLRIRTTNPDTPLFGAGQSIVLSLSLDDALDGVAAGGFGCAGCASTNRPPVRTGSGEGGAYALVLVGFLGYRRWLGRKKR